MRRLSTAAVVFSVMSLGCTAAAQEGYYCPPGAKFCPLPGTNGPVTADSSFGLPDGLAQAARRPASRSFFEQQLNEGEQLIMVAPNEQNGMYITPNPAAYAAEDGYAGFAGGLPTSTIGGSYENSIASSGGYASRGVRTGGYAGDFSDDEGDASPFGGGFIPPPPGSGARSQTGMAAAPTAPVNTLYDDMDDGYGVRAGGGRNYRAKSGGNPAAALPPRPKTFVKEPLDELYGDDFDDDDFGYAPPPQRVEKSRGQGKDIPSREQVASRKRKKKADILMEASEDAARRQTGPYDRKATKGRKEGNNTAKAAQRRSNEPEKRVPWWKGGMWRNRKADEAEREAAREAARAEARASVSRRDPSAW